MCPDMLATLTRLSLLYAVRKFNLLGSRVPDAAKLSTRLGLLSFRLVESHSLGAQAGGSYKKSLFCQNYCGAFSSGSPVCSVFCECLEHPGADMFNLSRLGLGQMQISTPRLPCHIPLSLLFCTCSLASFAWPAVAPACSAAPTCDLHKAWPFQLTCAWDRTAEIAMLSYLTHCLHK